MPDYLHMTASWPQDGRRVLIAGGGIAGPALAYWLHRYGFAVTVVEQGNTIRRGGYPVDLRGSAIEVATRMGILPRLEQEHIRSRRITFVDADGNQVVEISPDWITGSVLGRDIELTRGTLVSLLYACTRDAVEYRFSDSVAELVDGPLGVDIRFSGGTWERFDVVIGADGIHSGIRRLVFGPEGRFAHPVGFCCAAFLAPNTMRLSHEAVCYNVPGRLAALYAVGECPGSVYAILAFAHPYLLGREGRDRAVQQALTAHAFAGAGWKLPALLDVMRDCDDIYFDTVQQIRMDGWAQGRVALVGDAAYAPSFLTGQGSSLALVGAYVLASELARDSDYERAFGAYHRKLRSFVNLNQATLGQGVSGMIPATAEQLTQRNRTIAAMAAVGGEAGAERLAHSAIDLSTYVHVG
jgi:2-polyprenyl-6-methoxyphenol hydroxylase-like FAD-dependent oxidoreductase